jgi:hypothetical protein
LHLPIKGSWGDSPADSANLKLLRSWLVYDSEIQIGLPPERVLWNRWLGLALSIGISTGFWAGIGLVIARVWK